MNRARDGAWVRITKVTRVDCSKCGTVLTTRWPTDESMDSEMILTHLHQHGGRGREAPEGEQ